MACISKMDGRRTKRNAIWDWWTLVTHIWGTFDLVGFKVSLWSFGAVFSKWPITQQQMVLGRKWVKFGTRGVRHIWVTLDLVAFWGGYSVYLSQNSL